MNSFGYNNVNNNKKGKEEIKRPDYSLLIGFASLILSVVFPAFGVGLGYIGIKGASNASNDDALALSIIGFAVGIILLLRNVFVYI